MGYNIVDLLNKLIAIEQSAYTMYNDISAMKSDISPSIKTVAKVLAKEEERHLEFYKNIKYQASAHEDIEIAFDIYDKASSLVDGFKRNMSKLNMSNVQELLKFALEFEKENVALLLSVQGKLVRGSEDSQTTSYLALMDLITEEQKHVENLKVYVKG